MQTALVPTMGNLHDGHLALVEAARRTADRVITSIYVNPTQFGEGEDFESYPRTLETDRRSLDQAGCDLLFIPGQAEMYPFGLDRGVRLQASPELASTLEGASRPGHFDGVVTVVARLFNVVRPDIAVFGEKDFQQLLIIRQMVEDLGYGIRILAVPTVREPGGLAMSSRNNYLAKEQRMAAGELNAVLLETAIRIAQGSTDWEALQADAAGRLESRGFRVDYVAVRRSSDLGRPGHDDDPLRVLAAMFCGATRLIDNVAVNRVGISKD